MNDTNTNDDDKVIARNVTMFIDQWAVVDEVNERYGFRNVSLALRHIINEYRQMKATTGALPY